MCGRSWPLFSLLLVLCWPLSGQSFAPEAKYEVTGAELNQLETDLLTAKSELLTSQTENAKLQAKILQDSLDNQKALSGLETQLKTVYLSWTESKNEALSRDLWIGTGVFAAGFLIALLVH